MTCVDYLLISPEKPSGLINVFWAIQSEVYSSRNFDDNKITFDFLSPDLPSFRKSNIWRQGMTMIEIMVVAALSSAILLSAMIVMSRTGRTFLKGSDLINTQVLLESILTQLRDDMRRLRSLNLGAGSCDDHHLTFQAWLRDPVSGDLVLRKVNWTFDPESRTLIRKIDDDERTKTDFHGPGQVVQVLFRPEKDWSDFRFLTVVLQVNAEELPTHRENDRATKSGSRLAITCQFQPKCQEPLSSFVSMP